MSNQYLICDKEVCLLLTQFAAKYPSIFATSHDTFAYVCIIQDTVYMTCLHYLLCIFSASLDGGSVFHIYTFNNGSQHKSS